MATAWKPVDDSQEWELQEEITRLRSQLEETRKRVADFEGGLRSPVGVRDAPGVSMFGFGGVGGGEGSPPPCHSTPGPTPKLTVSRREILPEKYDGKKNWDNYLLHFESCKVVNKWSDGEAAAYLCASLTGDAVQVLTGQARMPYEEIKSKLQRVFGPCNGPENYRMEFRTRKRKAGESLPELAQSLHQLVLRAYPELPQASQEILVREQFQETLEDAELRAAIFRQRPETLEETVRVATEMECFLKAEKVRGTGKKAYIRTVEERPEMDKMAQLEQQMAQMMAMMEGLQTKLAGLDSKSGNSKSGKTCHFCKKPGHFKAKCTEFQKQDPEGYQRYVSSRRPQQGNETGPTPGAMGGPAREL